MMPIVGSLTGRRHEWCVLLHVDHVDQVTRLAVVADVIG